jgi:hypothetical protein
MEKQPFVSEASGKRLDQNLQPMAKQLFVSEASRKMLDQNYTLIAYKFTLNLHEIFLKKF